MDSDDEELLIELLEEKAQADVDDADHLLVLRSLEAAAWWLQAGSPQEQAEATPRSGTKATASSTPTTSPTTPRRTRRCSGAVS